MPRRTYDHLCKAEPLGGETPPWKFKTLQVRARSQGFGRPLVPERKRESDRDRDTERISLLPPNGNRKRGAAGESRRRGRLGIYEAGDGAAGSGLLDCYGDSGAAQGRAQSVIVEHGCRLTENMAV